MPSGVTIKSFDVDLMLVLLELDFSRILGAQAWN